MLFPFVCYVFELFKGKDSVLCHEQYWTNSKIDGMCNKNSKYDKIQMVRPFVLQ